MPLVILFLSSLLSSKSFAAPLKEKDLAIVFDTAFSNPIKAKDQLLTDKIMPERWYRKVLNGYKNSSIGNALEFENSYSEWQVVSMVVPCKPLVLSTTHKAETYCWPEVRLVMQPVVRRIKVRYGNVENYADDRAIHMLYDVNSEILNESEAEEAASLKAKIKDYISNFEGGSFHALEGYELNRFIKLRNKLTSQLINDTLSLRSEKIYEAEYSSHGLRPELRYGQTEDLFRSKMIKFLSKYNRSKNLKAFTSFSLPEGRRPAGLDEWIFLSFAPTYDNNIKLVNVPIYSIEDGSKLLELSHTTRGTMRRDSEAFYEINLDSDDFSQLTKQVFIFNDSSYQEAVNNILDPHKVTPDNTSCASCHRLNTPVFNFHNFSKLGTDKLNISDRVINDVKYDIEWLNKYFK